MHFHRNSFAAGIAAFVFLLLASIPAQATVLGEYDNRAGWESLSQNLTNIDFSLGLNPGGYLLYTDGTPLTQGGASLLGVNYSYGSPIYDMVAYHAPEGDPQNYGTGSIIKGPAGAANTWLIVTLPTAITSVGMDLAALSPWSSGIEIEIPGIGSFQIAPRVTNALKFWGIRTTTDISQVRLRLTGPGLNSESRVLLDNLSFGEALIQGGGGDPPPGGDPDPAPVPEPSTWLYAASGIGLVAWGARRRRT